MAILSARSQILLSRGAPAWRRNRVKGSQCLEHVAEGLAQSGVRFHPFLLQLLAHPLLEFVHDFLTVLLVEPKPGFGRERCFLGLRLVLVNLAQTFQHVLAFLREVLGDVDKLPSAMAQTVGEDALELLGGVARERVAHLDGG